MDKEYYDNLVKITKVFNDKLNNIYYEYTFNCIFYKCLQQSLLGKVPPSDVELLASLVMLDVDSDIVVDNPKEYEAVRELSETFGKAIATIYKTSGRYVAISTAKTMHFKFK